MEINVNDTAASRRGAVRMLNQSINLSCLPIIMRIRAMRVKLSVYGGHHLVWF